MPRWLMGEAEMMAVGREARMAVVMGTVTVGVGWGWWWWRRTWRLWRWGG